MPTYKVTFSDSADELITQISQRTGQPKAEIIRNALGIYSWLLDESAKGAEFVVNRKKLLRSLPLVGDVYTDSLCKVTFPGMNDKP